jgi:C_GCAxxG_C_C family probable redox protein
MKNLKETKQMNRRAFLGIGSCAGLLAAAGLKGATRSVLNNASARNLYDPLSPEEEKIANESALVKEILNLKGYSCAESTLLAVLKFLKKPEELVEAAAGFGGGMGHYDLCGMLTGGYMGLGFAAGKNQKDRKKMKVSLKKMTNEFWQWWESWSPIHCHQLKNRYDKNGYVNMKKRVAAKLEEIITKNTAVT